MARTGKRKGNQPAKKIHTWRIGVYIRLSREDGEDESLSVVNQKKIIDEYVEQFFAGEDYVVIGHYIDDGKTGTDYERPDFQRLMHDIERDHVNCVICKTLARAFRNYSDQGYFLESFFPRHQTRFISIGSPKVDTFTNPDAVNGLEVPITGLMNDRFAGKTSEDVRRTFNTKRRKGEFIGAFAPYGYSKDPSDKNRLVIDSEAAQVVRDIFGWFVYEGYSKRGIAKRLNEHGVPNPTVYKRSKGFQFNNPQTSVNDGLWSPKTIHDILRNKMYLGHMVQGKQKVISYKVHDRLNLPEDQWFVKEGTHEPIVSWDLFNKAQELSLRDTRTANDKRTVHLFSGYLCCADCKKMMQRQASGDKAYLICRTNNEKSCEKCTRHSFREDALEKVVFASIRRQIMLVAHLAEMIDKINTLPAACTQTKRLDTLLASRKQEYEKVRNAIDSLYMDWKSGDITKEDFGRMKEKFGTQILHLEQIIAGLEAEKNSVRDGLSTDHPMFTSFLEQRNIDKLDRSVLAALVDTIFIREKNAEKEVIILFKYADQFQHVLTYIEENAGSTSASACVSFYL